MFYFSWARNGCSAVITTVHNVSRYIHCRGRPFVVGLLQSIDTRRVVQNVVFVSQDVQPFTAPINVFYSDSSRDRATIQSAPRLVRASSCITRRPKRVCSRSTSIIGTKLLNFSRFNTQFAPVVMEAIRAKTGSISGSARFTETRISGHHLDVKLFLRWVGVLAHCTQESRLKVSCPEQFQVWLSRSFP